MGRTMRQRRRKVLRDHQCHQNKEQLLLEWMQEVTSGWRPHQLKLHTFTLASSFQLRGLMTMQPVAPGQILINVPHQLVINVEVAARALGLPKNGQLSSHQLLALFLVYEKAKGQDSFWHHYLTSLPSSYEMPCYSTEEESSKFPPYLKKLAEGQRELLVKKYLHCRSVSRRLDFNGFRWAWFTVNSRGVYSPDGSDNLALVPYLDMFNHSPEVRVKAESRPDGSYTITNSNMSYRAGDQALINYGPHSNSTLYEEYGFVISDNADDFFPLHLDDLALTVGKSPRGDLGGLGGSLGIARCGTVSWNTGACLFVLSGGSIEAAYETEDFLVGDAGIRQMCALLVDKKLSQVRKSMSLLGGSKKKRTASANVALELMKLHLEILERASKSLSSH